MTDFDKNAGNAARALRVYKEPMDIRMPRKRKTPTMSPALKSELRAEQCESAPELDAEVRALATFLTTEGIDCGKHTNAELASMILDFLVRRERH